MENYYPEGTVYKTAQTQKILSDLSLLKEAYINRKYLEARAVLCDSEHNLHFRFGNIKGYMPHNECAQGVADGSVKDIAVISRVNKPTGFYVTGFSEDENSVPIALLSRTSAQNDCFNNYVSKLRKGDIIDAKITHIEPFGAFCDIGRGITALLPINSVSVSRIPNPYSRFFVDQNIKAVVKNIDENGRITLSHRELLGTWEENVSMFHAGETVTGIIRSVEPYGIFVELSPNLAGLAEYVDGVEAGQSASVFIKSINPQKMKIKLIIVSTDSAHREERRYKYFIDSDHIERWQYSPCNCTKTIETVF